MTYNSSMKQTTLARGTENLFLGKWKAGSLAWTFSLVSILLAILAIGVSVRGILTSGNYESILSHQSLNPFITTAFAVIGALVASRRPRNPTGWIFVAESLLYALNALTATIRVYEPNSSPVYGLAVWFSSWVWIPAAILPVTFVLLIFPDGHLPSPRWRFIAWSAALGLAMIVLAVMINPGLIAAWDPDAIPPGPPAAPMVNQLANVGVALLSIGFIGSFAAFVVRFRRSSGLEREQMKWMGYAVGMMVPGFALSTVTGIFWTDSPLIMELGIVLTNLIILGIAVAAAIAILRHRLYDIDLIINRTLVYTALTVGIAALYGLVVGGLGAMFQSGGNLFISLVATGMAAILVQPMRDRLQRGANRLMYGERDDPYAVLSSLSRQLAGSLSPEATLPAVVDIVAQALKLPYVAIALKQEGGFEVAASYGKAEERWIQLPLVYQGETVGQLRLAARSPNESFTPAEQRLLRDIARHIGVTAHTVRLTQDLRQLAEDLQRSRERVVTAREEERRRLRRDLHDGLGPVLASQGLKLAALQQLEKRDPQAAGELLDQLIAQNEGVVAEIRRLVYGLRPPALDEFGLVAAVRDQVMAAGADSGIQLPVQVRIEEPPGGLPPLPAAVEVAAYRIVLEALTNVYRHAQAQSAMVRFSIDSVPPDKRLLLEICDDGLGIPEHHRPGVGLTSMMERAEEVGGMWAIESIPEGGTRVVARFPLSL
jgi:signal transduction histidine kinase